MLWPSRLAVFSIGCAGLFAQACPQLGLNTVEEAENRFYANRKIDARKLLEKAYSQCRKDGPVIRRIAEAYRLIGDDAEFDRFNKLADDVGARAIVRLTSTTAEPVQLPTFVRHKFALVVGVSKFKDFSAVNKALKPGEAAFQSVTDLEFAAKDAKDFAQALLAPNTGRFKPDRVELILDRDVTADRLRRAIAKIEQNVTEDDLVVLFLSSHGSSPDMDPAASNARSGFILMHDTEYRNVLNTATAFPMYELVNAINRFRARRVIAFLDTCYSGDSVNVKGSRAFGAVKGGKGVTMGLQEAEEMIRTVAQDRARIVVTSSGADEKSWESQNSNGGNGYFTQYLLEAMAKDGGRWNISQVYRYLNDNVPLAVAREKSGAPQHPQFRSYPNPQQEINVIVGAPESEGPLQK